MVLDEKKKSDAEYDINNLWNFPTGLSLQVKVGTFSPRAPQGQQLSISEHMIQWATVFSEVGMGLFKKLLMYVDNKTNVSGSDDLLPNLGLINIPITLNIKNYCLFILVNIFSHMFLIIHLF